MLPLIIFAIDSQRTSINGSYEMTHMKFLWRKRLKNILISIIGSIISLVQTAHVQPKNWYLLLIIWHKPSDGFGTEFINQIIDINCSFSHKRRPHRACDDKWTWLLLDDRLSQMPRVESGFCIIQLPENPTYSRTQPIIEQRTIRCMFSTCFISYLDEYE